MMWLNQVRFGAMGCGDVGCGLVRYGRIRGEVIYNEEKVIL